MVRLFFQVGKADPLSSKTDFKTGTLGGKIDTTKDNLGSKAIDSTKGTSQNTSDKSGKLPQWR